MKRQKTTWIPVFTGMTKLRVPYPERRRYAAEEFIKMAAMVSRSVIPAESTRAGIQNHDWIAFPHMAMDSGFAGFARAPE